MLKNFRFFLCIELRQRFRHLHEWLYGVVFFLITICLFPLALSPEREFLQHYMPGGIWLAALLASLLSIESLFASDLEAGFLEQYLFTEWPVPIIILPKLFAAWLTSQFLLILLTPLLGWWFNFNLATQLGLMISLLLGTPIIFLLSALAISLSIGLQQQGVLLSLILLPLSIPVLIFGTNIVTTAQQGLNYATPAIFLAGLTLLAILLLPLAIAAALKISLDTA